MNFAIEKILDGDAKYIPELAERIATVFSNDGYDVESEELAMGIFEILLYEKGGVFKIVAGMKTALKITLKPQDGKIYIKVDLGLFAKKSLTVTAIMSMVWWPLFVRQIWATVRQLKIDSKAMKIAEQELIMLQEKDNSIYNENIDYLIENKPIKRFCTNCGNEMGIGRFCPNCGKEIKND